MKKKNLLFTFDEMSSKDKAAKAISKYFNRAGLSVIDSEVSGKVKRSSGIKYKELHLSFADSQTVTLRIKESGDIFQVLLNKKPVPIKNQDNHVSAVSEISSLMDAGRSNFQKKMAKTKVAIPASARTSRPNLIKVLTSKRDGLKEAINMINKEVEALAA